MPTERHLKKNFFVTTPLENESLETDLRAVRLSATAIYRNVYCFGYYYYSHANDLSLKSIGFLGLLVRHKNPKYSKALISR